MRRQFSQYTVGYRCQRLGRFLIRLDGAGDQDKMRLFKKFRESARPVLETVHRPLDRRFLTFRQRGTPGGGQIGFQLLPQRGVIANGDVLPAEVFKLFQVEPRRALADSVEVEPFLRLSVGKELVIAMAPAQTREVIAHAGGRIAHRLVFLRAQCAVPF